jgi:hypothetical protein
VSTPTEENPGGQPPENPYGQPAENPYAQPQNPYGAPDGMPPAAPYYAVQPDQSRSGLAVAALCTFFLPLVGLVLSIFAMVKTGPGKMAGRGLAVTALVLSILATLFWGFVGYKVGSKTSALDPGCTNGKAAILDGMKKFDSDAAASDETAMTADIQTIVSQLNDAISKAHRADVRTAMQNVRDDFNSILSGDAGADLQTKLNADAQQIDNLCTIQ